MRDYKREIEEEFTDLPKGWYAAVGQTDEGDWLATLTAPWGPLPILLVPIEGLSKLGWAVLDEQGGAIYQAFNISYVRAWLGIGRYT